MMQASGEGGEIARVGREQVLTGRGIDGPGYWRAKETVLITKSKCLVWAAVLDRCPKLGSVMKLPKA